MFPKILITAFLYATKEMLLFKTERECEEKALILEKLDEVYELKQIDFIKVTDLKTHLIEQYKKEIELLFQHKSKE